VAGAEYLNGNLSVCFKEAPRMDIEISFKAGSFQSPKACMNNMHE
jgi:hypothetical protein